MSTFEAQCKSDADRLLESTFASLRLHYRNELLRIYGIDYQLFLNAPQFKGLDGLALGNIDEHIATRILDIEGFDMSTTEQEELSLAGIACALPFTLMSLLLLEEYHLESLSYFVYTIREEAAMRSVVRSLRELEIADRCIVASAMRFALVCYTYFGIGAGSRKDCYMLSADESVMRLIGMSFK
jgi:hypothetical protein